jgi:hypothetical protein
MRAWAPGIGWNRRMSRDYKRGVQSSECLIGDDPAHLDAAGEGSVNRTNTHLAALLGHCHNLADSPPISSGYPNAQ